MEDPGTATTKERPLIDAAQQVRHLKDRGVRFELTDEREAERFLRESNFFFKVKAFAKCFSRYTNPGSEHFGSYINLDFAHLAELTRLDHHLRETVLSLTLDIEHYMKVELNRMIMDAGDDPYELMASFFDSERERKVRVLEKRIDLAPFGRRPQWSEACLETWRHRTPNPSSPPSPPCCTWHRTRSAG